MYTTWRCMLRHTLVCHVSPTVHIMACVMSSLLYILWHVTCHPYCTHYGMSHVIPTVHTMACHMSSLLYILWHVSCHPYCTHYGMSHVTCHCTQYNVIITVHTIAYVSCHTQCIQLHTMGYFTTYNH